MKINEAKIVFMGTPEISSFVLESMILSGFKIVGVISQPDRPVGRKQILSPTPTKIVANKYNIPCFQPVKIRKEFEFVRELNPDLIITLAYGQIVPQALLDIPKLGCLNLHGSLLPKYRGASPIQYALLNGDKVTGMSLMRMLAEMDAGEVYATKEVIIDEDDNCTSLFAKMAIAAKELVVEYIPLFLENKLQGIPQDEKLVSFCPTIKPEEEKIDLNTKSIEIVNKIRALSDEPGAYFVLDNEKFKIYKAKVINNELGTIGQIVQADKNGLILQCKDGQISLLEVQKQGKKRMNYKDFINGNKLILHQILE